MLTSSGFLYIRNWNFGPCKIGLGLSTLPDWLRKYLLLNPCFAPCSYTLFLLPTFVLFNLISQISVSVLIYTAVQSWYSLSNVHVFQFFPFEYYLQIQLFVPFISTCFRLVPSHQLYSSINQFNNSDPHSQPMLLTPTLLKDSGKQWCAVHKTFNEHPIFYSEIY